MLKRNTSQRKKRAEQSHEVGTREAVETAIDQSKELNSTWNEQIRRVRPIRNWKQEVVAARRSR